MRRARLIPDSALAGQGQHCLIIGQTGSGKTVLAEKLVRRSFFSCTLDIKRRIEWEGFTYFENLDDLIYACDSDPKKFPHVIWQPDFEAANWEEFNRFYAWIFRRGNVLCYTDEASYVCKGDNIPKYLRALLMQGRELGISCYNACQRPIGIAQQMISEARMVYSFNLNMVQDREKLQATFAYPVDFLAKAQNHEFFVLKQTGYLGPFRARL